MMAPLALALLVVAGPAMPPGVRIAASAAAAQVLQGPLDGTWNLADASGRILYVFQIVDPVGSAGPQAAWRRQPEGGAGFVDDTRRRAGRLTLRFADQGALVKVVLKRRRTGWSGELRSGDELRRVTLRRP